MSESAYLKINEEVYKDNIKINEKKYNLMPTSVLPSVEIIKNVERSLGGVASVDITDKKTKLQVVFDILDNDSFEYILQKLNVEDPGSISPEGENVEYFDFGNNEAKSIFCYLDDITYTPLIQNDKIYWKDVILKFVEI